MPLLVVVGAQWGDEGKGKVVDYLTEDADLVVRFQGGNNAGHTVIVGENKTALRLIPSGILREGTRCLLASGVVLDPWSLKEEVEMLRAAGVTVTAERLGLAPEIVLVLPYHRAIDATREERRGKKKIGTTKKGIGPSYEDTASRQAIRVADLFDDEHLKALVERNVENQNTYLEAFGADEKFDAKKLFSELREISDFVKPLVSNVGLEVDEALDHKKNIVFEGAQGSLLDIGHGTYPFVTSSHTVAGFAPVSAGIGPQRVDYVLGIAKAYTTRVGGGPFPSEDEGADGDKMREVGKEFGTVTGRPRRCGWLDCVALKRTVRLNGITSLLVTKLDVLSGFDELKIATAYKLDGKEIADMPALASDLSRVEVVYESFKGWKEDITSVKTLEDLPATCQAYMKKLAEISKSEIGGFSVGPDREQTIILDKKLTSYSF